MWLKRSIVKVLTHKSICMKLPSFSFKKSIVATLLCVLLASPLMAAAQTLTSDLAVLRQQVVLLTEAIERSTAISDEKKTELRLSVQAIGSVIDVLAERVGETPRAESERRVNIENIIVNGSVKDFEVDIAIVWGPEVAGGVTYERSTTTHSYEFNTDLPEEEKVDRLIELAELTFKQLSAETGFSSGHLRNKALISFERFDDRRDVQENYDQPDGYGLEQFFGQYSIVDDILVTAGQDIFVLALETDQEEVLSLVISAEYERCERDNQCKSDTYTYELAYSIYDIAQGSVATEGATRDDIKYQIEDLFEGAGRELGVSDEVLIEDLLDFALSHTVRYGVDIDTDLEDVLVGASACHAPKMHAVIDVLVRKYVDNVLQYKEKDDLVRLIAPYELISADRGAYRAICDDENNEFFPSVTLVSVAGL